MGMNNLFWRLCERFYSTAEPPPRVRTKPMEVLCVGLPRSGTESLQKALLRLGYDYTYHGWDMLFEDPHRMQGWVRLARKKWYGDKTGDCTITTAEFDELLGHSVAVTDAAASCFAAELIAAYPDAKVILNVRDLDRWHASAVKNLCTAINDTWTVWLCWFHPTLWWMYHCHQRMLWSRLFRCTDSSLSSGIEVNGKWIYREHCAMIKGLVPKERLLEWDVIDGWEPLCKFLGKEIPKETFPRTNDAAAFHHRTHDDLDRQGLIAMINMFLFTVLCLWLLIAAWRLVL
ncbi:P-loop containing nucleoside triphosphate hydrolase protein [Hyaloscypha variabilis]